MNPSLASTRLQRCTRLVSVVPAAVACLLLMGLGSNAQASDCLADASGNPSLNCTANDFGVASVIVNTVLDDGCQAEGDTFTFNGSLNLNASNTDRFDVGFYIGADGQQAYTGSCTVGLIASGTGTVDDGDACGDFDGGALSVPIQNVTTVCSDTNDDGFYDVALCASWDNNTTKVCNGIEDAFCGTPTLCACSRVETNQPVAGVVVPTCQTNSDCAPDDNVCTDAVCDPSAAGCDALGCTQQNNTASCDNGMFCDGADVCAAGTCGHAGDPCVGGGVCGDTCNETANNCFDASGTVCRSSAGVCDTAETCTGSTGSCPSDTFRTSTCRASSGVCDAAESCSGSSATCPADGLATAGTICRASGGVCDAAETCNGASATCPADALATAGTICRSDAGDCDVAETCTGTSTVCPANGFNQAGATCSTDSNACTDDVCNAVGGCTHVNNTATCDNGLFCDGTDVCSGGTCGHSGDPCIGCGGGVCGDSCNEAADNCFDVSGTVCRAAVGACDVAETCTGSSGSCPTNVFSTGTCRASSGACDTAETCSGSSASCPADALATAGTICRSDAGDCDVAETCTGSAAACPANAVSPSGTTCGSDANACTSDVCNATGGCTHASTTEACDDGLFCTVNDACTGGVCTGTPRACTDSIDCTAGTCDETTNVCVQLPNDTLCNDADNCTQDSCSVAEGSCSHVNICAPIDADDICRSPGFWSTHSGYEKKNSANIGQLVIDAVGPIEVCGQTISATSNLGSSSVDGLGLSSSLEGLCMRTQGVKQRQLYRQLTAAALNCAISGDDCDDVLGRYVDVSFTECSNLCEGLAPLPGAPTTSECVRALDCFNNGGQSVDGKCAYGTCASNSSLSCGSAYGSCPDVNGLPQECVDFENSCHNNDLCNEDIGVCPTKTSASSPKTCKAAKFNDCTIDSCD